MLHFQNFLNKLFFLKKFEEMIQCLIELENKFEFLISKTEAYLKPITEFFEKSFFV